MILTELLSHLENVKCNGNQHTARCPAHDDDRNSLSVSQNGNKILVKCFAGCTPENICESLGLKLIDLFYESQPNGHKTHKTQNKRKIVKKEEICAYDYHNENGELLYQNVRYLVTYDDGTTGKDFSARRFASNRREIWNLGDVPRVPYRLPELLKELAEKQNPVIFSVEGEKDVENLRAAGFTATSHKNWKPEFNQFISGANVVIICDHDKSGVKQANDAARIIHEEAVSLRIVDLYADEPLPEKHGKDVSDWLITHYRDELQEIIRNAPLWTPTTEQIDQTELPLSAIRVFDAETKEINFLWKPRIARGMLTMISGAEGLGKSWLTCVLAAARSTGNGFPIIDENGKLTFESCEPGTVLMLSAEDSLSQIIKPRLEAVGANTKRIYVIDEPLSFDEKGLLKLRALLFELNPDLVIIDPIFAFTPAKIDINAANQSRAISKQLAAMAEETNAAFVLVRHIGKAKGNGDSRAAGLGSIDWRAAVRSELIAGTNPENETERVIVHDKCNYAPKADAISFTIENTSEGAQFRWLGKSNLTASALLGNVKSEDERAEQSDALEFLKNALSSVERDSEEVKKEAEKHGITPKQIRTARINLGLTFGNGIRREGFGGGQKTYWSLPGKADAINAQTKENDSTNAHKFEKGHLWTNESSKTSYSNHLLSNALMKEKGHLCAENGHLRASVEVKTVKDAAGVKLFDPTPEAERKTREQPNDAQIVERCWNYPCQTPLRGTNVCPNCEQDQNKTPF